MSKNILEVPFWKVAIRFTISFIVVLGIILTIITYVNQGNLDAISQSLEDGSWKSFLINRLAIAVIYGVAMAFFSRRNVRKSQASGK